MKSPDKVKFEFFLHNRLLFLSLTIVGMFCLGLGLVRFGMSVDSPATEHYYGVLSGLLFIVGGIGAVIGYQNSWWKGAVFYTCWTMISVYVLLALSMLVLLFIFLLCFLTCT